MTAGVTPHRELPQQLLVRPGTHPQLKDKTADHTFGWEKADAERMLEKNRERLEMLQYKLYADGRKALLLVLQGMDGAGKDGTIRHVMTAFNPQGCTVSSFKTPTEEERRHDYLWRIHRRVPGKGEVGIFNRSHYEDVLVVRVDKLVPHAAVKRRYGEINDFERLLTANDVHVVKCFLHISEREQRKRFEDRLRDPVKQWKFEAGDLKKRKQWPEYRKAYEIMLAHCSTACAPWYAIPSDHKWFRNLAVSEILVEQLERLQLRFPKPAFDPKKVRVR